MKDEVKLQFVDTFSKLITAAFAMVAALAWNEAIKAVIEEFITNGDRVLGLIIYAVLVTIIAVIATVMITRSFTKLSDKIKETED